MLQWIHFSVWAFLAFWGPLCLLFLGLCYAHYFWGLVVPAVLHASWFYSIEHSALMNGKEDESALLLLVSQWNLVRVPFYLTVVPSHLVKRTAVNLSISAKKNAQCSQQLQQWATAYYPKSVPHNGYPMGATTAKLRVIDASAIAGDLLVACVPPIWAVL